MTDYNLILPRELPDAATASTNGAIPLDDGSAVVKVTPKKIVDSGRPFASQAQAEAGTDATVAMSPLTTKQAIEAVVPAVVQPYVDLAEAWAESPTPPNPGVPDSKSAKTWAEEARGARDDAEAAYNAIFEFTGSESKFPWVVPADAGMDGSGDEAFKLELLFTLARAAGGRAYITRQYKIASPVEVPDGISVIGAPDASIEWIGAAPTSVQPMLYSVGGSNISIKDMTFKGPNNWLVAFRGRGVNSIRMKRIHCDGPAHILTDSTASNYDDVVIDTDSDDFNGSRDIKVESLTGSGTIFGDSALSSCTFNYTVGWVVQGQYVDHYRYAVRWWGGDSNPTINGAWSNERKCKAGRIYDSRILHCRAAVWGSMGSDIKAFGCSGKYGSDVCFDSEGSIDVVFTGCTGEDFTNGIFACFFYNRGLKFQDCTAVQPDPSQPLVMIYNFSAGNLNEDVTIVGGRMECTTGIGIVRPSLQGAGNFGPTARIVMRDIKLKNVKIDWGPRPSHHVEIADNELPFTVAASGEFEAIRAGSTVENSLNGVPGKVELRGNRVISTVSQPSGSTAMRVPFSDSVAAPNAIVRNNQTFGFTHDLKLEWSGSISTSPVFMVESNKFSSGSVVVTDTGSVPSTIKSSGNVGYADSVLSEKVTLTPSGGWSNFTGADDPTLTAVKTNGIVVINGALTGGTTTNGTVIATLPVGFRPQKVVRAAAIQQFPASGVEASTYQVFISNSGAISISGVTGGGLISLGGISFSTL